MIVLTPATIADAEALSAFANTAFTATFGHIYDPANERFFAAGKPGHAIFDIAAYVAARLAAAGVTRIAIGGHDTYAEAEDYFSYRRACHKAENSYGRQLSVIGIR